MKAKSKLVGEKSNSTNRLQRDQAAATVISFEKFKKSQRQYCEHVDIPRTTFQYWLNRKDGVDQDSPVAQFFELPEGIALLHQIQSAVHFVFGQVSTASVRNIALFFELSGLSDFVACSYGAQYKIAKQMENEIAEFGRSETQRLIAKMQPKTISMAEDETFHPEICAVGMEPNSGYIFLEKYVDHRDAQTWNQEMENALSDFPVKVIQVTSDEARGLINHIEKGLDAHHCPDLFHVSYEVSKATSVALAAQIKAAEKEVEKAEKQTQQQKLRKDQHDSQKPRGRRPDFEKKIEAAIQHENQACLKLQQARENQEMARSAKIEIGRAYHPYDLETGQAQDANKVHGRLQSCFETIYQAGKSLSDKCKKRVDKAHRVIGKMKATVAFFFTMIALSLDNINASDQERKVMKQYLIPGYYLQRVAKKQKDLETKARLLEKSTQLLSIINSRDGPCATIEPQRLRHLEDTARQCSQLFQRSSSCVEGRNAQLSLHHHGLHRLSDSKLAALTVIHNYFIKRDDGSTAAERLFESKPRDLFEWLLENMDMPARPRKRIIRAA